MLYATTKAQYKHTTKAQKKHVTHANLCICMHTIFHHKLTYMHTCHIRVRGLQEPQYLQRGCIYPTSAATALWENKRAEPSSTAARNVWPLMARPLGIVFDAWILSNVGSRPNQALLAPCSVCMEFVFSQLWSRLWYGLICSRKVKKSKEPLSIRMVCVCVCVCMYVDWVFADILLWSEIGHTYMHACMHADVWTFWSGHVCEIVHIGTYVWAHILGRMYLCAYICVYVCVYIYIYADTHTCMYLRTHIYVSINRLTRKCICMHAYICVYVFIHVCINLYVYTYTRIPKETYDIVPIEAQDKGYQRYDGLASVFLRFRTVHVSMFMCVCMPA
jgi:hypothetical protein